MCISKSKNKSMDCPFTLMKFIDVAEVLTYSTDPEYKVYAVDKEHSFITSKT